MNQDLRELAVYADAASAEVVAGLLRSEGIPVQVLGNEPVPGLSIAYRLMVPVDMLHRARLVLSQPPLSEEELAVIAAGQPHADDGIPK
jgi:hypothetical protein